MSSATASSRTFRIRKGIRWLTEVFSRSAEKYPNLTALQIPHSGESLTFAELDARAEKVAAAVSPFLTGPDQVVAVAMSQDNWQIVAAHLGILRAGRHAGGARHHAARRAHHPHDQRRAAGRRSHARTGQVSRPADARRPDVAGKSRRREIRRRWLDDPTQRLATIFYTSGTTGMPKGVECPHAGYVNLALTYADYFDLIPGMDASSLTSSLGYDGSISEMYSAWVSGCAVVMLTKEQIRSGPDLVPVLREAEVTVLFCPPVLLTTLTSTPRLDLPYPLCRYIVPAGEAFPSALVEPWTRCRRQIINTYGPTEASTDTSRQSLRPGEPITIGSPFANVTYVILEIGRAPTAAPRGDRRALHRRSPPRARLSQPAGANRAEVHHAPSSSAASTAPATNAKSTFKRSAFTSSAGSTRSSKCADTASRPKPLRTSCRRSSARSRPLFWTIRTRRSLPSSWHLDLRRRDLGGRARARGVGCAGDGDARQATSSAVGPDAESSWSKNSS